MNSLNNNQIRHIAGNAAEEHRQAADALKEMRKLKQRQQKWEGIMVNEPVVPFSVLMCFVILADYWLGWNFYANLAAFTVNGDDAPAWSVVTIGTVVNAFVIYTSSLLGKAYSHAIQSWHLFNKVYIEHDGQYSLALAEMEQKKSIDKNKFWFTIATIILAGIMCTLTILRLSGKTAGEIGSQHTTPAADPPLSIGELQQIVFLLIVVAVEVLLSVYFEYLFKKISLDMKVRKAITKNTTHRQRCRELDEVAFTMYSEAVKRHESVEMSHDLENLILRVKRYSSSDDAYFEHLPDKSSSSEEPTRRTSHDLLS